MTDRHPKKLPSELLILTYLVKNVLYAAVPRFGYCGSLKRCKDPDYSYEHDKPSVLRKHNSAGAWQVALSGVARRSYDSYDEYVQHQAAKYDAILKGQGGLRRKAILSYRMTFYRRFRLLSDFIGRDARILCLGARQGTEVEVLRDLGYRRSIRVDLNPGPSNPYVLPGDFMRLVFLGQSFDCLYSNAIDHAYDLEDFFIEAARVLKSEGLAIWDIAVQGRQTSQRRGSYGFESVRWDREETVIGPMLRHFKRVVRVESERSWKWLMVQGTI